jgi:hypothetical protein
MRDALRNSELTTWHQMVGARLFGVPVLEWSAQLHCRRVVWSLGFGGARFLFRLPVRSIKMDGGVLTRRCVVYKEKMLGIIVDLSTTCAYQMIAFSAWILIKRTWTLRSKTIECNFSLSKIWASISIVDCFSFLWAHCIGS